MKNYYTEQKGFYGKATPLELLEQYGSPLYVYNEAILRERCREMRGLVSYPKFRANYSIKANSNIELLRLIRQEGLSGDAMSPGEINTLLTAGFAPEEIFYVGNNVSREEMQYAIDRNILTSIDSLSQLKQYGSINPGGKVAVRFNPGTGAGHHEKVVTAGKKTKFGINLDHLEEVKSIIKEYSLKLAGINQHIGSLFMDEDIYIACAKALLEAANEFEDLDFVDLGGGFGIPYHKQDGQHRLNIESLGNKLTLLMNRWVKDYGKEIEFKIEPGRYIVAECGVLIGTVHSVKENYGIRYIGTDLGFNVLTRPVMYDSYHDIEVYPSKTGANMEDITATIVGNICESGDIIAGNRKLPWIEEGDILGIMDAGAYGYSMSSNYNNRLRPAEVLIRQDGSNLLIRRRDTLEDLMRNFVL